MIVLGAALGFGAVAADASVSLASDLAVLAGTLGSFPAWAGLRGAALAGLLAPTGLFLAVCGILIALRSHRPPGRSRAFRAGLLGASVNLASGLVLGVLNFTLDVLPPALFTTGFLRSAVVVLFLAAVAAGAGLLVAFSGVAALVREDPSEEIPAAVRVRPARGKSMSRTQRSPVTMLLPAK